MRIAVSGTHRSGKSTLIDELSDLLPTHVTVDEPYHQLEEEGYAFAATPSVEEFEAQLARSIADLDEGPRDVLFDRCPVDFIGYLLAHEDRDAFDGFTHFATTAGSLRLPHAGVRPTTPTNIPQGERPCPLCAYCPCSRRSSPPWPWPRM